MRNSPALFALNSASGGKIAVAAAALATLSACATAPSQPVTGVGGALTVCRGGGVSNAPPTDRQGRIQGYSNSVNVRGAYLLRAPVAACVSSGYGPRRGGAGRFHYGVDLFTRTPAPVLAGGDGVVVSTERMRGYGKVIIIRHNRSVTTRYAHLSSFARGLTRGDRVRRGDVIGLTGNTGNATAVHLHYEIRVNGKAKDPLSIRG